MNQENQRKIPIVTIILIAINVIIWLVLEFTGSTQDSTFMLERGAAFYPYIIGEGEWWRLFTCMFLHFGAEHLVNNMLLLGAIGTHLENTLGSISFGILYLLSGMCGSLLSLWREVTTEQQFVSAGASGAVFGIIGGLIAWAVCHKGRVDGLGTRGLLGMAALSLYYGFATEGVDNWGHIGGLTGGLVLGFVFALISKICKHN